MTAPASPSRFRGVIAGVLATVGLLLVPPAVMAHWATVQLVETERFVAALAPLADDPAVQDRIILEVTALVDEQIDISAVTSDLLTGLGEAIDLGDRAQEALNLVSEPIAAGVRALIEDVVGDVVRSPEFSAAWASSVQLLHSQTIRLLSGSPDSLLQLERDGTLGLPLGPVVADVRSALDAQGVPFAAAIPDVDRTIVLAELPNLALARVIYQVGIAVGVWLPILSAVLLATALLLAPRRPLMLRTLGILTAVTTGLLALGFVVGRTALTAYVGPDSSAVTGLVYDAVLGYALTTIVALLVLGLLAGIAGWWFGPSPAAVRGRRALTDQFARVRIARQRRGFGLGTLGVVMYRERLMVHLTLLAIAALPALLIRPLSAGTVLASAALALGLMALAEALMTEPDAGDALGASVTDRRSDSATATDAVDTVV